MPKMPLNKFANMFARPVPNAIMIMIGIITIIRTNRASNTGTISSIIVVILSNVPIIYHHHYLYLFAILCDCIFCKPLMKLSIKFTLQESVTNPYTKRYHPMHISSIVIDSILSYSLYVMVYKPFYDIYLRYKSLAINIIIISNVITDIITKS